MPIWKEQTATLKKDSSPLGEGPAELSAPAPVVEAPRPYEPAHRPMDRKNPESVIAAGLTIEGKVSGNGDVRIAGQFHGDVHVEGSLTIESGAKMVGGVRAASVVIDGELEGNIESASRVELRSTAIMNGNLTTGTLTVAAGSKMRGQVEFGWAKEPVERSGLVLESKYTS